MPPVKCSMLCKATKSGFDELSKINLAKMQSQYGDYKRHNDEKFAKFVEENRDSLPRPWEWCDVTKDDYFYLEENAVLWIAVS